MLCLAVNLGFDNAKAVVPLLDILQSVHFLFYLEIWLQPNLTLFSKGLNLVSLRTQSLFMLNSPSLWNCPLKSQLIFGGCSLYNEFVTPLVTLALFFIINFLLSRLRYFERRESISWSHAYCCWWLCSSSFALTAFSYLGKS